MKKLTHLDENARAVMVDVGDKPVQIRIAEASGFIRLGKETVLMIREALIKKGDVLTIAEIAGIQAAKRTPDLIPLCHSLITDMIHVKSELEEHGVRIRSEIRCHGKTGAEMEALMAVSAGLLTVYDMCKAVDKSMVMEEIHLVRKEKI